MGAREEPEHYETTAPEQEEIEAWAESQLVPWNELADDDWRFDWKGEVFDAAKKHHLPMLPAAACIYEAARESDVLRGWAVLAGRIGRNRRAFDVARLERLERKSDDLPCIEGAPISPWHMRLKTFRGVDGKQVEEALCQAIECFSGSRRTMNLFSAHEFLARFGNELAVNASFADLWRGDRERVMRAVLRNYSGTLLEQGPLYNPICGHQFSEEGELLNDGLCVAWERVAHRDDMTSEERRAEKMGEFGNEAVVFSIHWRAATNQELVAEFFEWLRAYRPTDLPEPSSNVPHTPKRIERILRCLALMRRRKDTTDSALLGQMPGRKANEAQIGKDARLAEEWCREVFCFGGQPYHAKKEGRR